MKIVGPEEIRRSVSLSSAIAAMRAAVIAQSRGECDTPMPMHLDLSSGGGGEVHIKSGYRKGGGHFALKVAGTYVTRPYGSIVLVSVETGETVAWFDDGGYLTDLRTAAVSAMVAKELGRRDTVLGILGTGVQARLQAQLHAEVLPLAEVCLWGRTPEKAAAAARDIAVLLPGVRVVALDSPADVAARAGLIVAATASRAPLLAAADVRPGTHVSAPSAPTPPASRSSTRRSCAGRRSSSSTLSRSASGSASSSTPSPRRRGRSRSERSARGRRPTTAPASPSPISPASAPRISSSPRRAGAA